MSSSMKKTITFLTLVCFVQTVRAQFFIEVGANAQVLNLQVKESPSLSAVSELITIGGGNPSTVLPKRIQSRTIAPKISIGYRVPFEDFNLLLTAGTSQDFGNSFKLRGSASVGGKTYPYPESFSVRARAYKTLEKTGFSFGGEVCFDNQKSEMLIANSNLDPKVIGLLNQIGSDMNLLGNGSTRNMQINALIGWQKTHDQFELGVYALAGLVGKSFGGQLDMKVRYFFGER